MPGSSIRGVPCADSVLRADEECMKQPLRAPLCCATGLLAAMLGLPSVLHAQVSTQRPTPAPRSDRVGLDLFGGGGLSFPAATDSFDAVDLNTTAFEFGGGARVTGLWRRLFVQVAASQWSDDGERAFVGSDGEVFPLGIPLEVKATFVDATIGVKDVVRSSSGRISYLHYFGAGAGVVRYRESSPFAEPGDDLDTTEPSYHVLAGVEVPIAGALAVAVDGRYRYIPNVLGEGGVSGVLDEDSLGGFQLSVALRLGLGGPRRYLPPPARTPPAVDTRTQPPPVPDRVPTGVISEAAPVFVLPDATRTPLRTLAAGTSVRILEEKGDWVRVEFNDQQYGRRVGYVERRFVELRKEP